MIDTVVIINVEDIPLAVQVCQQHPGCRVMVFDPLLVDKVADAGIGEVAYIPWHDAPSYPDCHRQAREKAFSVGARLQAEFQKVVPGISVEAWQYLNWYYFYLLVGWYSALWERHACYFADTKVHLFVCDRAGNLYHNSFIPSVLLMLRLQSDGVPFVGYLYGNGVADGVFLPDMQGCDSEPDTKKVIVHVPTIYHDVGHFNSELDASGRIIVNLESRMWNVPVRSSSTAKLVPSSEALPRLPDGEQDIVSAFCGLAGRVAESEISEYISAPTYLSRQVESVTAIYRAEMVFYFQICRHFCKTTVSKIVLSDHDVGYHGPIVSFAETREIPVVLVPHSKTSVSPEFGYDGISVLAHPSQEQELVDRRGKRVRVQGISYPGSLTFANMSGSLGRVVLVLNSLSINGICVTPHGVYFDGIRRIVEWAKARNVDLVIRCRLEQSVFRLLEKEVGCDAEALRRFAQGPLEQYVAECDVCLLYDAPTTGVLRFLDNGVGVLHAVPDTLSERETWIGDCNIIPQESVDRVLDRLGGLHSDPVSLYVFRLAQFSRYVSAYSKARPLRHYL